VDPNKCEYPDIIKPLAFLIWFHPDIRVQVLEALGVSPKPLSYISVFTSWARQCDLSVAGSLPNVLELLLMYHTLRESQHLK
jgi:hypothetical protein